MKIFFALLTLFLPLFGHTADKLSSEVVISIGCGNGLVGSPGDLVVVQEASGGGRLLGLFPKKDADNFQAHTVNINIGSGNGLMGKPGDIMIVQEAPGGGIPLGLVATDDGKFDPKKQIKISFHRGNGLIGNVGDLVIHQPGPFGGNPLATFPRDGGKDCKAMKLRIGLGNGIRGKKTEVVVVQEIKGSAPKLLTTLKKPSKANNTESESADAPGSAPAN